MGFEGGGGADNSVNNSGVGCGGGGGGLDNSVFHVLLNNSVFQSNCPTYFGCNMHSWREVIVLRFLALPLC